MSNSTNERDASSSRKPKILGVHTLDARGNIMLEVMRDHLELSPAQMLNAIQSMRLELGELLASKGIEYEKLKSALVPDRKRDEIALVFDRAAISDDWYGRSVFAKLIPLLARQANHSILVGDYLGKEENQPILLSALNDATRLHRTINVRHSSQLFIVYINNLTPAMIASIEQGLSPWRGFAGIADTTYSSRFKTILSTMLVNSCLKHGQIIIQGHEDDRDAHENVNMCGYPYEDYGYECRSVPSSLAGVLLSYKIERPVLKGFEVDTEFSLNSVNETPSSLAGFAVEVEAAKIEYLRTAKLDSLERAGLEDLSASDLAARIDEKVSSSYIYNMTHDDIHGVTKFNVIIELSSASNRKTRLLAALEYKSESRILRLITLY